MENTTEEKKMFCRKCGKELTEDMGFCVNCGLAVPVVKPKDEPKQDLPKVQYCKNCGKKIDINATICMYCATWVKEESKPQAEKKTNGMAIAGFVCSFIIPLLGWIFGGIGLAKANKLEGKGMGFSIAALIIATFMFLVNLAMG